MANYNVDIDVALKGSEALRRLTNELRSVSKEVGKVNAATIKAGKASDEGFSRKRIQNVDNYSKAISKAERTLRRAAMGTDAEKEAVKALVGAQKEYNQELERQNRLIRAEERAQGLKKRVLASDRVSARSDLSSPVMGARDIQGSPMARDFGFQPKKPKGAGAAAGVTGGKRLGAAVSAGAFPLLFGGGPGMALGGALGGAISGATFGPLSIALQVLGGAADESVANLKQLGIALKDGKGVAAAYEVAIGRLSSSKREYLTNLERSGQIQKLFNATLKQAKEDAGPFGELILDSARTAAVFDDGVGKLINSLKALVATLVMVPLIETFGNPKVLEVQEKLTQAAKDRINVTREELNTADLTAQTIQKRNNLEDRLNSTTIEQLAAAQTAEVVEKERAGIAQIRQDVHRGIKEETVAELEIEKLSKTAQQEILAIERERKKNFKELADQKHRAAVIDAQQTARAAQESLQAFKNTEALTTQLNIQLLDAQIMRKNLFEGEEAALKENLQLSDKRLEHEKGLLALENAALKASLAGLIPEDQINEITKLRVFLLEEQGRMRKLEISDSLRQLQIQKDIANIEAKQVTKDISTGLTRQIEDASFAVENPFGTDDSEMLQLRIKQIRRTENAQNALNKAISAQNELLKSDDPDVRDGANKEIKHLKERIHLYKQLLPQLDAVEQAELRQQQILEKVQPVADAVAAGLVNVFRSIADGSMSAKEAFANMLMAVADALAQQATKMIATYIAIGIARLFAGLDGVTSGEGVNLGKNPNFFQQGPPQLPPIPKARGGFVTGPTNALIGEGGEPEYVVPASKMNEAMGRYARGARGAAVIPDRSGGDAGGEMGGSGGSIDVSYSVERINNVNYVTAAEFEKGMAQAAKRGAELGKRGVYSDLINKRSVRSRVSV